jgi:hypothetical protein
MKFLRLVLVLALSSLAGGQKHRDPLNAVEIDQLRETALEPEQRLKLIVKFARARLDSLQQARSDPKTTDVAQQTHDLLQDFLGIYDELNDNLDMYSDRKDDIRKPLKAVIEADVEFQAKLRGLKDASPLPKDDPSQYQFVLSNALQAIEESIPDHRQLMTDQEELARKRKK